MSWASGSALSGDEVVDCEIIEYFPTANDAYDAGCERYGLGNFSIQEIGAAPISLGAQTLELL